MQDIKDLITQYPYRAYVYVCYINNTPVYVGKGTRKRYLHCTSGKSSNDKLNQALAAYGPECVEVKITDYNLMDWDALAIERRLINSYLALGYELYNKDIKTILNPPPDYIQHQQIDFNSIPEWVTENIEPMVTGLGLYKESIRGVVLPTEKV